MATLDEIFAAMPDAPAGGTHELLIIDADTREIYVPDSEKLFGVEHDGNAETKYFQCPRYVGKGIDLAACFLRVNFQNANGDRDGYLVKDTTINGERIYFSWELWPKVTQYKGTVQFVLCASLPGSTKTADWHTTLAQGNVLEGLEPDAEAVAAAGSDLIAQLLATVQAQEANVEAVGAEQVQTVQAAAKAAQEAAVAEVEAKKQNVLAQLPADYTAMGQHVDALARSTAGAIVCQAEGTAIQVHDASDHPLAGLRIFGRSTQDGTPTPDNPVEIVSTPAPTVTVAGGNLCKPIDTIIGDNALMSDRIYCGGGCKITVNVTKTRVDGVSVTNNRLYPCVLLEMDESGKEVHTYPDPVSLPTGSATYSVEFITAPTTRAVRVNFTNNNSDTNQNTRVHNVSVMAAGMRGDAGAYAAPKLMTITTPVALPGIPVASGGNYTDADGQQWICDEVDLTRGVYVQRIAEISGNVFSKVQNSAVNTNEYKYDTGFGLHGNSFGKFMACTHVSDYEYSTDDEVHMYAGANGALRLFLPKGFDFEAEKSNIKVIVAVAGPVETPLSEAELAAFAALHSVKPTTTILNDSGAHMAVEYVADTKLYIDSKLAELVAAMNG